MSLRACLAILFTAAILPVAAHAETVVLTIGGGPSPSYNQISLEKNVVFFEHILATLGGATWRNDVYFADGGSPFHTVKYEVPSTPSDNIADEIVFLSSPMADPHVRFEPVSLKNLQGPATSASIRDWFSTQGKKLHAGDKLFVYVTGHGGDAPRGDVLGNTTIALWNVPAITMREFDQQLDKLDPAVDVTLIMVQCHSGGFANVLYKNGDPARGFSPAIRCGFFSTTAPRLASGCTPEVNEDDYQDFSTHFFAALSGQTRTHKSVQKPDYDAKGWTSFADAFTYVLLNDDTIDIPVLTSDQLLRDFSHYRGKGDSAELLDEHSPYTQVLATATPSQKGALEGLSAQLKVTGEDRMAQVAKMSSQLQTQRDALMYRRRSAENSFAAARKTLHDTLIFHYPELGIAWQPDSPTIVAKQSDALQHFLESQPDYKTFEQSGKQREELLKTDERLEAQWVKTQRFLECGKTVILAANLPKLAKPDTLAFYDKLVAREHRAFVTPG
jgi:hypothetical protein